MAKYLDYNGLSYLWTRIKTHVINKINELDVDPFDIATESDGVVTINRKLAEVDGKIVGGTGITGQTSIVLNKVATSGKAEDVSVTEISGFTGATNVQEALVQIAAEVADGVIKGVTGDTWIQAEENDEHVAEFTHLGPHTAGATGATETTTGGTTLPFQGSVVSGVNVDETGHVVSVILSELPANPISTNTTDKILLSNGTNSATDSVYGITGVMTGATYDIPTDEAVKTYVDEALRGGVEYKGVVDLTSHPLPSSGYAKGDLYVVKEAGTYAGKECEIGDWLLANKDYVSGAVAADDWDAVNGENQVDPDLNHKLRFGTGATIATIDGTDIPVILPPLAEGLAQYAVNDPSHPNALHLKSSVTTEIGGGKVYGVTGATIDAITTQSEDLSGGTGDTSHLAQFGVQIDVEDQYFVNVYGLTFKDIDDAIAEVE